MVYSSGNELLYSSVNEDEVCMIITSARVVLCKPIAIRHETSFIHSSSQKLLNSGFNEDEVHMISLTLVFHVHASNIMTCDSNHDDGGDGDQDTYDGVIRLLHKCKSMLLEHAALTDVCKCMFCHE